MAQVIGSGGGGVIMESDKAVTANTTLSDGENYMSIGHLTINNNITVTVNSGARWVII